MSKKTNIQRSSETKEKLLYAAAKIISEKSSSKLTLDEVAKEANISKGGLLHHFKTKESLIEEIGRLAIKKWEALFKTCFEKESDGKGRFMRAYIRSSLDFDCMGEELLFSKKIWIALISELFENPSLIKIFMESELANEELMAQEQLEPEVINVIRIAVDGLMLSELFHNPFDSEMRAKVIQKLIDMTR